MPALTRSPTCFDRRACGGRRHLDLHGQQPANTMKSSGALSVAACGLHASPRSLPAGEVEYIVKDSVSKVLFASAAVADVALGPRADDPGRDAVHGRRRARSLRGFRGHARAMPTTPVDDESAGSAMLYSSGTTGRPKGVKRAATGDAALPIDTPSPLADAVPARCSAWAPDTVYLVAGAALSRRAARLVDGRSHSWAGPWS